MQAASNRLEFAPPPTPGLLRALALAMLAHAFLLAALTWGVHWKREAELVTAQAELWSALPQEAAPQLVEVAPPPPEPEPPITVQPPVQEAPPDAQIALQQEKRRLEKQKQLDQQLERQRLEKLKQDKLELEKKRLQEKREQERLALEKKQKTELETKRKDALLAQEESKRMEAQRQDNIKRMTGLAGANGASGSSGNALQSSGPSASYAGRIRARIKPNIVFTEEASGNPQADVEVHTAPDGTIISRKLTKPSGNKAWDEAVIKAIDKTAVLPRDVDGRVISPLTIGFTPKD
jgi:colicin import membrane protein